MIITSVTKDPTSHTSEIASTLLKWKNSLTIDPPIVVPIPATVWDMSINYNLKGGKYTSLTKLYSRGSIDNHTEDSIARQNLDSPAEETLDDESGDSLIEHRQKHVEL